MYYGSESMNVKYIPINNPMSMTLQAEWEQMPFYKTLHAIHSCEDFIQTYVWNPHGCTFNQM